MKGFGRLKSIDVRDRPLTLPISLVGMVPPPMKMWRVWWTGDQGDTNQCVGYAMHGLLRALPILQRDPRASIIYHEAQKLDEFAGEDYEGTSVRGGAKALKADGKIVSYGWANDVQMVLQWLAFKGPVVLGTNWYESMMNPDATGLIVPGGEIVGGHAYLAIGYDSTKERLICQNSWSRDWGPINGRFHLHYDDADALIKDEGEACTSTEAPVQI
jgi:hypothetical protein